MTLDKTNLVENEEYPLPICKCGKVVSSCIDDDDHPIMQVSRDWCENMILCSQKCADRAEKNQEDFDQKWLLESGEVVEPLYIREPL